MGATCFIAAHVVVYVAELEMGVLMNANSVTKKDALMTCVLNNLMVGKFGPIVIKITLTKFLSFMMFVPSALIQNGMT